MKLAFLVAGLLLLGLLVSGSGIWAIARHNLGFVRREHDSASGEPHALGAILILFGVLLLGIAAIVSNSRALLIAGAILLLVAAFAVKSRR